MDFTHKSCSACPPPSDEEASANRGKVEMEDLANEEENGEGGSNAHSGADSLSVMFPPCQDPLLANIYRGLPALPCVAYF
jgi:hypothetical protein